ncbi:hypothetical protein FRC01_014585 [Tulasnella sp. 417]|nr:hypothetical protein FRC01_014585 [Tulasnella sp. 417]
MTEAIDQETYKRLAAERITNTNIGPFDQVTIVSQRAVNGQLAHMWRNPDSILRKIDIKPYGDDAPDDFLVADLDPPTVNLSLGPNKQTVIFCINIKSGTLGWYEGVGPRAKSMKEELGPSRLALRVNMAHDQLEKSLVPDSIKQAVGNLDDYSIGQLFLDFTKAIVIHEVNRIDRVQSEFKISSKAEPYLYGLLNDYFSRIQNPNPSGRPEDKIVVHYTATAKNAQVFTAAPTCVPTSLNFQNLPFVLKADDRTSPDPVLGGKNSMLVYLQMTNNHQMPNALLEPSANWVMPTLDETTEQYDGVVCLSKASFLDGFLLPRLANFNRESTWVVDEAWWKATNGGFSTQHLVYGHLGLTVKDLQDPFFQDYQFKLTSQQNGARRYEYRKTHRKDDNHGLWRVYQEGRTWNAITIPEGLDSSAKCVMKLIGSTDVETYLHLDGIGDIGKTVCKVRGYWEASLILDGIDDGELKITVESPKTVVTSSVDESFRYPDILNDTKRRCEAMFQHNNFYDIKAGLEKLFSGSWAFVFAQGRDFFIDKACFNREGDLLCQLKYKSQGSGNPVQPSQ